MKRFFTSHGMISAPDQRTADHDAHSMWLEDGWERGGYRPWTREEFEAHKASELREHGR